MAELAEGLTEVDEQSAALYARLDTLGAELRNDTETFQQAKQVRE